MKLFSTYINEETEVNEVKIIELSYFDFINLCDTYKPVDFRDKQGNDICKIIKMVSTNPEYSKLSNKYHFLAAIKEKQLLGVFYKQLRGNPNIYDDGYIISKGAGQELFMRMRKLGPYTTFSNINNIASLKAQLKMGAEVLCITDNIPDKTGAIIPDFKNEKLKQLLIDEKIYYKDEDEYEEFFFYDEKGNLNIKGFTTFLTTQDRIKVVSPSTDIASKVKVYFLFKKL